MTTIDIRYDIKDLLLDGDKNQMDDFTCKICFELMEPNIRLLYQCRNGHTACRQCWSKILTSKNKSCMECRKPIRSWSRLSRCRLVENIFNSKLVNCPYAYTIGSLFRGSDDPGFLKDEVGSCCSELVRIEQLDKHQEECKFRFVVCVNENCRAVSRFNALHQLNCPKQIVECVYCRLKLKRSELPSHCENSCSFSPISCNQCNNKFKRLEIFQHVAEECPNSIVQCRFKEFGCNGQFKRLDSSIHLEQVNHTLFMLKLIDKQAQQIKELKHLHEVRQKEMDINLSKCFSNSSWKSDLELVKENFNIYTNVWEISSFIQKAESGAPYLESPLIELHAYKFRVFFLFENKHYGFGIKLEDGREVQVKFSAKFLNVLNLIKASDIKSHLKLLHPDQLSFIFFPNINFITEPGYVFNNSVRVEIKITILKPPFKS